jgi:hypothetical protein
MANLSRKSFIEQASVTAVAAAALATVPGFALSRETAHASAAGAKTSKQAGGPLLAHVRNASTGEIAVLFGTHEVVIYDRAVAARLMQVAR